MIYFNKPFFILLDPIRPNLNPLRDYIKINLIENLISKKIGHEKSTIVGNGFLLNSTLAC